MKNNILYNSLFIGLLVLFIPTLFSLLFSFIKIKRTKSLNLYIYSFMSSMMIILSTLGFMREGYVGLEQDHDNHLHNELNISDYEISYPLWMIVLIVSSGVLLGMLLTIGIRLIVTKFSSEIHLNHEKHNHADLLYNTSDIETKSSFITLIWSLIAHKIVAGLSIAITVYNSDYLFKFENIGMIIILLVHMIPESIMICYKGNQIFNSKVKSLLLTFALQVVIIISLIIGIYLFNYISTIKWIMPFINCIAGGSIFFVSIFDLVPEFIHNKNMSNKEWLLTIFWFVIGTIFGVVMCLIHEH